MSDRIFPTGSVRDKRDGKGRYDLIPPEPMRQLAGHYEYGATRYQDRNWERGQHLMSYLDSAERHLYQLKEGRKDENHAIAAVWNLFGFIQTLKWIEDGVLPGELDDRPEWSKSCDIPCESGTEMTEEMLYGEMAAWTQTLSTMDLGPYETSESWSWSQLPSEPSSSCAAEPSGAWGDDDGGD